MKVRIERPLRGVAVAHWFFIPAQHAQTGPAVQRGACTDVGGSKPHDIPWIVVNPIEPLFLFDQAVDAALAPHEPSFFVVSKPRRGSLLLQTSSPILMAAFALRAGATFTALQ